MVANKKKKISELFNFLPKSKIKAGEGLENGKYPFYTCSNELTKYYDEYTFEPNKLIFGTGGSASLHYASEPFATSTDCYVIEAKELNVDVKYVYYYLKNNFQILEDGFKGAGLKHISKDYLSNIMIEYPDIEEQQRIVNILDKAEEIRTKKKLANKKLDEFLKSTFIDMFGDPVTNPKDFPTQKLNDIATLKNGINFLKGDSGFEVKCLGVSNFKDNNFIVDSTNFNVVEVSNKPSEDYYLKKNDIVFVRSNGSKELVGRTVLIKTEGKIVFSGFCIRCRLTSNMNPIYLLMLLKTESMKNAFSHDGHGCNIKSLNQQMLGNLDIIISPLELQNQFAQIVHKVEAQKEKNQKVIEQMDNLFNSLMQQAFNSSL